MTAVLFLLRIPRELSEDEVSVHGGCASNSVDDSDVTVDTKQGIIRSPTEDISENITEDETQTESESIGLLSSCASPDEKESALTENDQNSICSGVDKQENSTERITLEDALHILLQRLNISDDVWSHSSDKCYWQVTFTVQGALKCDSVLNAIVSFGFGSIPETSLSLYQAYYQKSKSIEDYEKDNASVSQSDGSKPGSAQGSPKRNLMKPVEESEGEFVKSIKSRLTVAQVVEGVKGNAVLSFDFLSYVILASLIAAIGLAENSSVILVASMLVSPIMGPILGGTFGFVVHHYTLMKLGIRNEILSLTLCLISGLILGLIMAAVNINGASWGGSDSWPTPEMQSRGLARSLWVGVLIALPSGAGVALSILSGNAGSLVGVAISASLLPPAVNAGMLWSYGIVTYFNPVQRNETEFSFELNSSMNSSVEIQSNYALDSCPPLTNNNYKFVYSCDMPKEAFLLGLVSFFLTLINIICIFIMSIIVLKIKEVAPSSAISDSKEVQFWKKDIKIARDVYKTVGPGDDDGLQKAAKDMIQGLTDKKMRSRSMTMHGTDAKELRMDLNKKLELVAEEMERDALTGIGSNSVFRNKVFSAFKRNGIKLLDSITEEIGSLGSKSKASEIPGQPLVTLKYQVPGRKGSLKKHTKFNRMLSLPHDFQLTAIPTSVKEGRFVITAVKEKPGENLKESISTGRFGQESKASIKEDLDGKGDYRKISQEC